MTFKQLLCLACVCCSLFTHAGLGQEQGLAQTPPHAGSDPFKLDIGSSFSASGTAVSGRKGPSVKKEAVAADFEEALAIIRQNHVAANRSDPDSLTAPAITTMLKSLDPHSNYYTPAEFQSMLDEHASEYTGIGTSIAAFERNGRLETYVLAVMTGSPAARADLKFGDRIVTVDGIMTAGKTLEEVRALLRGKKGSILNLSIERGPAARRLSMAIRRERLHETAVPRGFVMPGGVGYIDVTNGFSNSTFAEFESALSELKRGGAASLVVDLRGNGGGILDQAIRIAEKFLPAGSTIVSQRGRTPADSRKWRAGRNGHETMPLVLLLDDQSASATEVLAGALQDNDRALIVGNRTFGKGLVQNVLNLPEGAGLTLTAARYYTPAGRSIQREYAESGLYNYYNHRMSAEIDKPVYAARTPTGRIVFGGDGIAPDVQTTPEQFTPQRVRLLAPIFQFSVKHVISNTDGNIDEAAELRAGRWPVGQEHSLQSGSIFEEFRTFLRETEAEHLRPSEAKAEKEFVNNMLKYYISMGVSGIEFANRVRVESDPEVIQALMAMPRAASLNSAARKARLQRGKQKGPLSLVLNGQR